MTITVNQGAAIGVRVSSDQPIKITLSPIGTPGRDGTDGVAIGPPASVIDGTLRVMLAPVGNDTLTPAPLADVGSWIINSVLRASAEAAEVIARGQPVMVDFLGKARLARADNIATSFVLGLAAESTGIGFSCPISRSAVTMSDWTAVVGSASLVPGARYFLHPTIAGRLTTTPPVSVGQVVAFVGQALSASAFVFDSSDPIIL